MYSIVTVVYGVLYDGDINQQLADHQNTPTPALGAYRSYPEPEYDELEEFGWEFLYDGGADFGPGYLGITLDALDAACMPHPNDVKSKAASTDSLKLVPDNADKAKWQELLEKQPDWLTISEPKTYFVWSSS